MTERQQKQQEECSTTPTGQESKRNESAIPHAGLASMLNPNHAAVNGLSLFHPSVLSQQPYAATLFQQTRGLNSNNLASFNPNINSNLPLDVAIQSQLYPGGFDPGLDRLLSTNPFHLMRLREQQMTRSLAGSATGSFLSMALSPSAVPMVQQQALHTGEKNRFAKTLYLGQHPSKKRSTLPTNSDSLKVEQQHKKQKTSNSSNLNSMLEAKLSELSDGEKSKTMHFPLPFVKTARKMKKVRLISFKNHWRSIKTKEMRKELFLRHIYIRSIHLKND